MRGGVGKVFGPRKACHVGVSGEREVAAGPVFGSEIESALVLHVSAVGEALRQKRVVSVAVEALHGCERELLREPCRGGVDGGECAAAACCGFSADGQPVVAVAVVDAGVPEARPRGVVLSVELAGIGLQGLAGGGEECCYAHVEASAPERQMCAQGGHGGIVLSLHLALGAVVACFQYGLDGCLVLCQGGIYQPPRCNGGEVEAVGQLNGCRRALQVVGRGARA